MRGDARFSPDRRYRYMLSREWPEGGPRGACLFIGLNPSTADEVKNDPTITRCINFAREWGYSSMLFGNLFGIRSTDPKVLYDPLEDSNGPENNEWLLRMVRQADRVVLCWGNHGACKNRGEVVVTMLSFPADERCRKILCCFGLNQNGQPKHPLYLPRTAGLMIFRNPLVPKDWVEKAKAELTTEEFKRQYIGDFKRRLAND